MRIAIFPDDYLPESTLVHAKMLHELALEFQARGHCPVIITPGSSKQQKRLIIEHYEGVEVWRFRNGQTRGVGKVKRAINESLLSLNAWLAIRHQLKNDEFDLCVNYSPTIFFGPLMYLLKNKMDCYIYLILRDLFPQWVIDEGLISESSLITRYFRLFESINYKASDHIGLMSPANLTYFKENNPACQNLSVLRNWADLRVPYFSQWSIDIRDKCGCRDEVIYFYGGNIGHAQDMSNLMRLARAMKNESNAHFLFVGQGDEFDLIVNLKYEWQLNNVTILSSVNQKQYQEILQQVDVGLFSLAKSHKAHNFPGKLLGYMNNSLPILGSVNPGNDLMGVINSNNIGAVFVNGEDDKLLIAARSLLKHEHRKFAGKNGKRVLKKFFSVQSAVNNIISAANISKVKS